MSKTNENTNITRHISFTAEEDKLLQQRAEAAGIAVAPYIRQQALNGVVHSIDWEGLRVHSDLLSDIAMQIELHLQSLTDIERAMLADVLTAIERDLKSMLVIEQEIFHFIVPGLDI